MQLHIKLVLLALKNVAEARINLVDAANELDSDWENCYQLLAQGKIPTLSAIALLTNTVPKPATNPQASDSTVWR